MDKYITYKKFNENEIQSLPVSTLAWIGDAVYGLCAREYEVGKFKGKSNKLHKMATSIVNAEAQSFALEKITSFLSEEELGVVRRAKNSPITTKSKHYGIAEYKKATALEALVGYLYLLDRNNRLNEILERVFTEDEKC